MHSGHFLMSLLGVLRRIENGADMWLASNEGPSSNYSKAESMLRAFSQHHDASITGQSPGIKCQFMYRGFTLRIYIKPRSYVIETWNKEKHTENDVRGDIEDNADYKHFCGLLQSYGVDTTVGR